MNRTFSGNKNMFHQIITALRRVSAKTYIYILFKDMGWENNFHFSIVVSTYGQVDEMYPPKYPCSLLRIHSKTKE